MIPVVDTQGKEIVLNYGNNGNVLFYLSVACTSCGDVLSFADRLQKVFGEESLLYFCGTIQFPFLCWMIME